MSTQVLTPRVAILGGGPAGLSAARVLGERLGDGVLVIEREAELGGIPRHSDHPGYGIRDRKRFLTGPAYAEKLAHEARQSGVTVMTRTQVTGWGNGLELEATSPSGRLLIRPDVLVLATARTNDSGRSNGRSPHHRPIAEHGACTWAARGGESCCRRRGTGLLVSSPHPQGIWL